MVEVVGFRGDEVFKKTMRYDEALKVKAPKSWTVKIYQVGYCSAEATNKKENVTNTKGGGEAPEE